MGGPDAGFDPQEEIKFMDKNEGDFQMNNTDVKSWRRVLRTIYRTKISSFVFDIEKSM